MPACCPSPVCVDYWVSAQPGPPSGVQVSSRPVSSPSGVQPVQCPVIWLPRPDAAVRPSGVQPVRRPAVWCPPVRPVAAVSSRVSRVLAMGETSVRRGSGHDWIESSSMWSGPVPGGSVDGPRRHGCGHRCGGRVQAGGGASPRTWAGWCFGGRLHPTDQAGQTAARAPVAGDCARAGELAGAMSPHGTVRGGHLGLSRDYSAWSLRSLTSEWTGRRDQTSSAARMARGPSAARLGSERDRFDAGNAVTCKNDGGRDRV